MGDEIQNLTRRASRRGIFGGHEMFGFQFESETGKVGWLITAWTNGRDPVRAYWVEGGEFFLSNVHYGYNFSNRALIQAFGTVPFIDPKLKEEILQAVSEWEKE